MRYTMQLLRLFNIPTLYGILVIIASIIMFSLPKKMSMVFPNHIGSSAIIIYYLIFFSTSLGTGGKIPLRISVFFSYIDSIDYMYWLININETNYKFFSTIITFCRHIILTHKKKNFILKPKYKEKRWANYRKFWKS